MSLILESTYKQENLKRLSSSFQIHYFIFESMIID